jgi:hypothetical protein
LQNIGILKNNELNKNKNILFININNYYFVDSAMFNGSINQLEIDIYLIDREITYLRLNLEQFFRVVREVGLKCT